MRRTLVAGGGDGLAEELCRRLTPRLPGQACEVWDGRPGAADVLVYLGESRAGPRASPDSDDAAATLAACAPVAGAQVVLVSSAMATAPSHRHPGLADEGYAGRARNAVAQGWRDLEARLRALAAQRPGFTLTVLRPAVVLPPRGRAGFAGLFSRRLVPTLAGHNPPVQFLSLEDLAEALALALERPREGVFNVAPRAPVLLRRAVRLAGARRLPLPRWLRRVARALGPRVGREARQDWLEYLRYSWTTSGARVQSELGYSPRRSSAEALAERFGACRAAAGGDDDFGLDTEYVDRYSRTLFRFLHDVYWRVDSQGLEHVPCEGPALLVGVHRGLMPFDGTMVLHGVARATGRYTRFLIHPALLKFPFLGEFMTRLGGVVSCPRNADHVLGRGGLLGVFPEGIHGAFTLYRDAYRLGKFGRDEYVRMALRHRAPIVPFVTVGSAEIFPILARLEWRWWKRQTEWPFFPLTPTFPLLPLPLPSKWHTLFLPPLDVAARHSPEAARDPATVRAIGHEVRESMQAAWAGLLVRRRSVFFGALRERAA